MRRGRENGWLLNDSGELMGVNLGSDFTAEHEWGIDGLKNKMSLPARPNQFSDAPIDYKGLYGIERRRCKADPKYVALKEEGDILNLIVAGEYTLRDLLETPLEKNGRGSEWRFYSNDNLVTAWTGDNCIIRVKGEDGFKKLRELYNQLLAGNVAMWLGGGGVFKNAGLCFCIIDKIPESKKKALHEGDIDQENLKKAADATGIKKKIDDANERLRSKYTSPFGYYALSPRWAGKSAKTKHKVVFWLNPQDQEKYETDLFTVEDLEDWLKGKGPVLKSNRKGRR